MPRAKAKAKTAKASAGLVDIALDALEDELACWQRWGSNTHGMTMLVRRPYMRMSLEIGPADVPQEMETVTQMMVPDKDVNEYLRRAAIEKVVEAVLQEVIDHGA